VDTVPGLARLQARKRELLLESDLNRQILRVEVGRLTVRAGQLKRGYGVAQNAWKWALPVAGFLFARKLGSKKAGIFTKSSIIISGLRGAWKLWGIWRQKPTSPDNIR